MIPYQSGERDRRPLFGPGKEPVGSYFIEARDFYDTRHFDPAAKQFQGVFGVHVTAFRDALLGECNGRRRKRAMRGLRAARVGRPIGYSTQFGRDSQAFNVTGLFSSLVSAWQ